MRIKNLVFSDMKPLVKNPMISQGIVDIAYSGTNRNHSFISDEVMKTKLQPSVLGVPIVGEYFKEIEDFGDHGEKMVIDSKGVHFESTTIPYGFVPPNATLTYVDKIDKDGVTRKYLRADCFLWTGQYPECDRVIKTGNPQSMELDRDTGYLKRINGEDYYVIEDAIITKLCILGSDVEPCFEGASFGGKENNITYSLDKNKYECFIKDFTKQIKEALNIEEKNEGGKLMKDKEQIAETDKELIFAKQENKKEEEVESKKKEVEDKEEEKTEDIKDSKEDKEEVKKEEEKKEMKDHACGGSASKEKEKKYSQEFAESIEQIQKLTMALQETKDALEKVKIENESLKAFKAEIDKENKEKLFSKFKDKIETADFDNLYKEIESNSYESLEFQLCKLYTAKTLNSREETSTKIDTVKSYSLNSQSSQIPSWVDAVQLRQKHTK